jgi:hypothetical protein
MQMRVLSEPWARKIFAAFQNCDLKVFSKKITMSSNYRKISLSEVGLLPSMSDSPQRIQRIC